MYKPFISHQFWGIPILKHKYSQSKQRNGYGSIPINTIFSGLFTSINPSYFDVNKKGVLLVLTHCHLAKNDVQIDVQIDVCLSGQLKTMDP